MMMTSQQKNKNAPFGSGPSNLDDSTRTLKNVKKTASYAPSNPTFTQKQKHSKNSETSNTNAPHFTNPPAPNHPRTTINLIKTGNKYAAQIVTY